MTDNNNEYVEWEYDLAGCGITEVKYLNQEVFIFSTNTYQSQISVIDLPDY